MSAWLPSPATAAVSAGDPLKRKWLTIGQRAGAFMALSFAAAISILGIPELGYGAIFIFVAAVVVLAGFLWFWRMAMKEGEDGGHRQAGLGT